MIFVIYILINLTYIICEDAYIEERTVDEDDPKIFHGYLLKKMMESIPDIIQRWKRFKEKYKFKYYGQDNKFRFFTYAKNAIFIQNFMKQNTSGFEIAENSLAHLSREEYFRKLGTYVTEQETLEQDSHIYSELETRQDIPSSIDWRTKNAVTPVKDQKNCGGCYAFSAIASLEGAIAIKTGNLVELSEQQIIDCSTSYGNKNCDGGRFAPTFNFMRDNFIANKSEYPYTETSSICQMYLRSGFKIKYSMRVSYGNERALANAVLTQGPIAVVIDAKLDSFRFYKSGIYNDPACAIVFGNHAVTLVGITDTYYILKNSWGTQCGINGYVHMARDSGNMCGVAAGAMYPII